MPNSPDSKSMYVRDLPKVNHEAKEFTLLLRKALIDNTETCFKNKKMFVRMSLINNDHYHFNFKNVIGNGFELVKDMVKMPHLKIALVIKDHKALLTAPNLYNDLHYYFESVSNPHGNPITSDVEFLASLADWIKMINTKKHRLPGEHYQNQVLTNCDKFTMTANGKKHVRVIPLNRSHQFYFAIETSAKRSYIINAISCFIDTIAYLFKNIKTYFGNWKMPLLVVKGMEAENNEPHDG